MAIAAEKIEQALLTAFPGCRITLEDYGGDQDHYNLSIAASQLEGALRGTQHRMIYKAITEHVGELPHALTITIQKW
ncbi:MAG: BolA/IbaG family iron-sulfur metabolism protein [Proteobacteria bacterium]|nr:BolA/IbaG family iron-sulfur metabolism protein [Pseudomonadota bacterium]